MDDITNQKINSIFEIFVGFLIVDNDVEEVEVDEMMLVFFEYLEKFIPWAKLDVWFEETLKKIAEDEENFSKNTQYLSLTITFREKVALLKTISKILFIDDDFSITEYELFKKLMDAWEITNEDLKV